MVDEVRVGSPLSPVSVLIISLELMNIVETLACIDTICSWPCMDRKQMHALNHLAAEVTVYWAGPPT